MLICSINQIWFGFVARFLVLIAARIKSLCSIVFSFSNGSLPMGDYSINAVVPQAKTSLSLVLCQNLCETHTMNMRGFGLSG